MHVAGLRRGVEVTKTVMTFHVIIMESLVCFGASLRGIACYEITLLGVYPEQLLHLNEVNSCTIPGPAAALRP